MHKELLMNQSIIVEIMAINRLEMIYQWWEERDEWIVVRKMLMLMILRRPQSERNALERKKSPYIYVCVNIDNQSDQVHSIWKKPTHLK